MGGTERFQGDGPSLRAAPLEGTTRVRRLPDAPMTLLLRLIAMPRSTHRRSARLLLGLTLVLGAAAATRAAPAQDSRRFEVEWRDVDVPTSWGVGDVRDVTVTVVNRGTGTWLDLLHADRMTGRGAVRVTYCWRDAPGTA